MHKQKCLVNKAQNQILEWYANNLIISKQKRIISNQKTDTQSGFKKKKNLAAHQNIKIQKGESKCLKKRTPHK